MPHVPASRRASAAGLGALTLGMLGTAGMGISGSASPTAVHATTVHESPVATQATAGAVTATPSPSHSATPATPSPTPAPGTSSAPASHNLRRSTVPPPAISWRAAGGSGAPVVAWGLVEEGWPQSAAGLAGVESVVRRSPNFMESYVHWGGGWGAFTQALPFVQASITAGATPVLTWMSDDPTTSNQSAYDLNRIAQGDLDSYVRSWADGLRGVGHSVFLRFDPEMNGNWENYATGRDGQTAADYVDAWRHIHAVFAAEGATNVRWVWSPNVEYPGSAPLRALYPGDGSVDWLALDGYNWGTTYGHAWQTFSQVFDSSLATIEAISARPLMLAEVGSTETGGNKAAWIAGMFNELAHRADVRAFIWFDLNKETDWRIASTSVSSAAFVVGLASLPVR